MSTIRTETTPGTWDDARDGQFFRITSHLFSPDFCLGATVLLASYDDEPTTRTTEPTTARVVALAPREERTPQRVPRARGSAA